MDRQPAPAPALIAVAAVVMVLVVAGACLSIAVLTTGTAALFAGCGPDADGGLGGGSAEIEGRRWSAEQTENAATIVARVITRGLPRRAAVIAVSTAIVESGLVNVTYGDRDSLGLYQQRPSMGWGSPAQVLNPVGATDTFLDRLVALPGWASMAPGQAAQAVQRSAFPDRYGPQEASAAALVEQFWVGPDTPPSPVPDAGDGSGEAAVRAAAQVYRCPDTGGAGAPLTSGAIDPKRLPPGFAPPADQVQRAAVGYALAQLGKPYVWGGKGPDGFDCSGLMLAAWAHAGVAIPAGTVSQKNAGDGVPIAQIAPGDLVFIPGSLGSESNPRHNGMYVGHGLVVNAYDSNTGVVLQPLSEWADEVTHVRRVHQPGPAPGPGSTE